MITHRTSEGLSGDSRHWPVDATSQSWPPERFSDFLTQMAAGFPHSWVADDYERLGWADLSLRSSAFASELTRLGVVPGDRVALWGWNSNSWLVAWFGTAWAGAIAVPVNTRFTPEEVSYVLEQSGSSLLLHEDGLRLDGVDLSNLSRGVVPYSQLDVTSRPEDGQCVTLSSRETPNRIGMISYTSGSTSFPKGAMLNNGVMLRNGHGIGARLMMGRDDVLLCANPLFHNGGSVFSFLAAVTHGSNVRLLSKWEPRRAADIIRETGITVLPAIDTMLRDLIEIAAREPDTFDSLRAVATATPSKTLLEDVTQYLKVEVSNVYGLTEASPNVAIGDLRDSRKERFKTIGRPQEGLDVLIVDAETGERLGVGQSGEIRVRGWAVMSGYYENDEATMAALTDDGWLRTGDLGSLDERGYLQFQGRLKQMIKSGGENVSIVEVEGALVRLQAVADACVVPVPHDRYTEVGYAFVRPHPNQQLSEEALVEHSRAELASFKVPKYFEIIEELPRVGSGKLDRATLRDRALRSLAMVRDV